MSSWFHSFSMIDGLYPMYFSFCWCCPLYASCFSCQIKYKTTKVAADEKVQRDEKRIKMQSFLWNSRDVIQVLFTWLPSQVIISIHKAILHGLQQQQQHQLQHHPLSVLLVVLHASFCLNRRRGKRKRRWKIPPTQLMLKWEELFI